MHTEYEYEPLHINSLCKNMANNMHPLSWRGGGTKGKVAIFCQDSIITGSCMS